MPELPEVETVVRQLAPLIEGRRVLGLEIYDSKLRIPPKTLIVGRHIDKVFRSGKQAVIALVKRKTSLVYMSIHLRMTGRLLWSTQKQSDSGHHLRARLKLSGGNILFYDPRRFGTLAVTSELPFCSGVDPLSTDFTLKKLRDLLRGSRQALKLWLMRQDRLIGIGNIYASEILFAARLNPARPAGTLTPSEQRRLWKAINQVLRLAINCCGTSFSDFLDISGERGGFRDCLQVYGREAEPCSTCGSPLARITQGQRSTFFCRRCQSE